jgi:hypothetical protein
MTNLERNKMITRTALEMLNDAWPSHEFLIVRAAMNGISSKVKIGNGWTLKGRKRDIDRMVKMGLKISEELKMVTKDAHKENLAHIAVFAFFMYDHKNRVVIGSCPVPGRSGRIKV